MMLVPGTSKFCTNTNNNLFIAMLPNRSSSRTKTVVVACGGCSATRNSRAVALALSVAVAAAVQQQSAGVLGFGCAGKTRRHRFGLSYAYCSSPLRFPVCGESSAKR